MGHESVDEYPHLGGEAPMARIKSVRIDALPLQFGEQADQTAVLDRIRGMKVGENADAGAGDQHGFDDVGLGDDNARFDLDISHTPATVRKCHVSRRSVCPIRRCPRRSAGPPIGMRSSK